MLSAIMVSSMVMGFLPLALKKVNPILKKRLLSFGNCFAGGVFFAIGFLHLLAESTETMHDTINPPFPLSYILAVVGFFGVFFIEKVLLSGHHHHQTSYTNLEEKGKPVDDAYGTFEEGQHSHESSGLFAYILTFVLSLHSLVSGVALGMDKNFTTLISLFVAIISHKWIEAFALGVAINKVQIDDVIPRTLKLITLYSFMEPMGIIIGLILSTHLNEEQLLTTQAFVLGVASGTFIYVAVVDILPSEFSEKDNNDKDKYWKFLLLIFGVGVICVVVSVFTHSHDELY